MMTTEVSLFVDGSCRGNPGQAGCAILQAGGREKALVDGADATTNNRMELTAVLTGLQALKRPCAVTVVTDSQYVAAILGGGQAKANRDLVQQVRAAAARHTITVQWVAGHSGHALNERCDRLARAEATRRVREWAGSGVQEWSAEWGGKMVVVNFKRYGSVMALNQAFGDRWVYIGRANSHAGLVQSPLANPFKVSDYGGQRGAAIDDYRHWLWGRILSGDTAVPDALRAINEKTVLVCW
ncbi:MAG: DUF4326 domain-containing protein [Chloroflexi bacterium]|nr:DUF4326 domain-containing protein [Chloroflexota bacterium]